MFSVLSILYIIFAIVSFITFLTMVFSIIITIKGFYRGKKEYPDADPEKKFLILVPAHNEEAVISDIINNLNHMDYPKELYDFYILADNCTDNTAAVAKANGANVFEFFKESEKSPTGKPIALEKAFAVLDDYYKKYDYVMFFDADNWIESNMLKEINSQMIANPDAVVTQCYIGSKNKTGPVAAFYHVSFVTANRFIQFAKYRLGLNAGIGGTGFAVDTKYLNSVGGWKALSLTEDFEFQIKTTVAGKRILWNNHTRVHDEKPTTISAFFKQQLRWAQGHWYVTKKNFSSIFKAFFKGTISFWEFVSTSSYIFALLVPYLLLLLRTPLMIIEILQKYDIMPYFETYGIYALYHINLFSIIIFVYLVFVLFYLGDYYDNNEKPSFKYFFTVLLSIILGMIIVPIAKILGLFKSGNQHTWVKTEHKINMKSKQQA